MPHFKRKPESKTNRRDKKAHTKGKRGERKLAKVTQHSWIVLESARNENDIVNESDAVCCICLEIPTGSQLKTGCCGKYLHLKCSEPLIRCPLCRGDLRSENSAALPQITTGTSLVIDISALGVIITC